MLPQEFWQGVEEFNCQEFYACHDTLESLWMETTECDKNFYQGILQIAVGCYHLGNSNWRGAVILLGEGIKRLNNYQPTHEEVDVKQLVAESLQLLKTLQKIDPTQIDEFVQQLETQENVQFSLPKIVRIKNRL